MLTLLVSCHWYWYCNKIFRNQPSYWVTSTCVWRTIFVVHTKKLCVIASWKTSSWLFDTPCEHERSSTCSQKKKHVITITPGHTAAKSVAESNTNSPKQSWNHRQQQDIQLKRSIEQHNWYVSIHHGLWFRRLSTLDGSFQKENQVIELLESYRMKPLPVLSLSRKSVVALQVVARPIGCWVSVFVSRQRSWAYE